MAIFASAIRRWLLPLAVAAAVWQLVVYYSGVPEYILPSPVRIASTMIGSRRLLLDHGLFSLIAIVCGFMAAALTGFTAAVLIAYSRRIEELSEPFIIVSQVVPKVALAPLFLLWFGYGLGPKVVIAASIAFFPVLVNTILGLKSVEREVVELMDSIAASKRQIFWMVRLPNSLPYIFPSLKVAALLSVVGAMVGEFVGSDKGLGYLMVLANTNIETDLLFAAIVAVTLIGLLLYAGIGMAERAVLGRFGDGSAPHLAAI